MLRQGRALYEDAFRAATVAGDPEAYYPAINAATLALFAGDAGAAGRLAGDVLDLLTPRIASLDDVAADRYWVLATALECHLVRGDLDAARGLVDQVVAAAGRDDAALATTARQLERIVAAKNLDSSVLAAFKVPTVVHFLGDMHTATEAADVAALLEGMRVGAAYGSLAAGAEIMFAEALLEHGVALNVVLPFAAGDFIEHLVRPAGEAWVRRFEDCLAAAKTVRFATEDAYLGDDQLLPYSSSLAMGLASLCARHLHAPLMQLAAWDGVVDDGATGTAADMSAWREAGHPVTIVPIGPEANVEKLRPWHRPKVPGGRRDTRAMLFGDIHGFSKLTDAQLPTFTETIMGTLGKVARRHEQHIALTNTWGDGIFVVFRNAGRAAACALDMQDAMNAIDLKAAGLPETRNFASVAIWDRSMNWTTRSPSAPTITAPMSAAPPASSRSHRKGAFTSPRLLQPFWRCTTPVSSPVTMSATPRWPSITAGSGCSCSAAPGTAKARPCWVISSGGGVRLFLDLGDLLGEPPAAQGLAIRGIWLLGPLMAHVQGDAAGLYPPSTLSRRVSQLGRT